MSEGGSERFVCWVAGGREAVGMEGAYAMAELAACG